MNVAGESEIFPVSQHLTNKIMKTIAEETLRKVQNGARFSISLTTRTMHVDGKTIIDNGKYEGELWGPSPYDNKIMPLDYLEGLYYTYKHSVPSERSESRGRNYFTALKEKDLDDEDMMFGIPREEARFQLEFALLAYILTGELTWNEEWGKWFWQSEDDRDFVILRSWVDGN